MEVYLTLQIIADIFDPSKFTRHCTNAVFGAARSGEICILWHRWLCLKFRSALQGCPYAAIKRLLCTMTMPLRLTPGEKIFPHNSEDLGGNGPAHISIFGPRHHSVALSSPHLHPFLILPSSLPRMHHHQAHHRLLWQ